MSHCRRLLIAIGLLVFASVPALAQEPKPLSQQEVETLLRGGVVPKRVITFIKERGVSFRMTPKIQKRLQTVGADQETIKAIKQAEVFLPPPPLPPNIVMIEVPAGNFLTGCNEAVDQECEEDEKRPAQQVFVPTFKIDKTEVSVRQYRECVQAGRCTADGLDKQHWGDKWQDDWERACNWDKRDRETHPINCVDWHQANTYCSWAGKRLPTETEWEKAARGTDGYKYPWGNSDYLQARQTPVANIADESSRLAIFVKQYDDQYAKTAPVDAFPRGKSPFGALNMVGNVAEWVADDGGSNSNRVIRGGSWFQPSHKGRTSYREQTAPPNRFDYVGFRCAQ